MTGNAYPNLLGKKCYVVVVVVVVVVDVTGNLVKFWNFEGN